MIAQCDHLNHLCRRQESQPLCCRRWAVARHLMVVDDVNSWTAVGRILLWVFLGSDHSSLHSNLESGPPSAMQFSYAFCRVKLGTAVKFRSWTFELHRSRANFTGNTLTLTLFRPVHLSRNEKMDHLLSQIFSAKKTNKISTEHHLSTMTTNSNNQNTMNDKNIMTIKTGCYEPRNGYTTAKVHEEYCSQNPDTSRPVDTSNEYNLTAGDDYSDPLFFWQLFSLLGDQPIVDMVTDFYKRVFADDEAPWFRQAFERTAPFERHVATQAAYWIDAMGGGKRYHGGEYRLHFHHSHNASQVMMAEGAKRWMYHMRKTLQSVRFVDDPRIKPCILEFLRSKMMSYADQFGWKFDESDFELYQNES